MFQGAIRRIRVGSNAFTGQRGLLVVGAGRGWGLPHDVGGVVVLAVAVGLVGVDGLPERGRWAGCCGGGSGTALVPSYTVTGFGGRWRAESVEALSADMMALRSLGLV